MNLVEQIDKFLSESVDFKSFISQIKSDNPEIKLDVSWNADEKLAEISRIVVPKNARERGVGSQIMQQIVDFADENQITVALTPSTAFGGSKSRLEKFYKRFGFVPNSGRNKDFRTRETMIRPHSPGSR